MSFEVNQHVGDYEIIGLLGAGGMGKVCKVRNVISDRIEAMKVLLPDLATEPELAERFTSEIKVLAGFNHPNIAALHTALRIDNQLVMIMELVEGITLEARLRQGPVPLPDCLNYVSQVLDALSYAHEQGVIHRDIKPANMMLTPGGVVKLMDFGIAKSTDAQKMTVTGATLGSLYYMSPEQVKGIHLDTRSDLYSMGVSIYELVTGKRPFQGDSNYAIMAAHLQSIPRPPIELDPKLPKALNEIILTCLSKDPSHRFGSAKALRTAIESVRASVGPSSAAVAQPQSVPRSAVAVGATGATAVLAGASTAAMPSAPSAQGAAPLASAAVPASAAPPATASRGYRGFYMALGALVAVVIIVLAAMELPRWLKTRAGAKSPAHVTQPATSAPSNPSSPAAASSSASPTAEPGAAPAGAPPGASPAAGNPPPPTPGEGRPGSPPAAILAPASVGGAASAATGPIAKPRPAVHRPAHAAEEATAGAVAAGVSPSTGSAPAGQTTADAAAGAASNSSAAPKPSAEDSQELNDRMTGLTARANAVKDSLENLRRQQNASGLSLRGDVSASLSRMEQYMDAADRALAAGNSESAGKSMDRAEHEIEGLEKFLGR